MRKTIPYLLGAVLLAPSWASAAQTTTAATPPAGFFKLGVRGATDTPLSLPLARRSALLAHVTAVGGTSLTLDFVGVPDGTYAPTATGGYYLQFTTGDLEGLTLGITAQTGGTVELAVAGITLTSHPLGAIATGASGDIVRLRPFWTVHDIFGATEPALLLDPTADHSGAVYIESDAVLLPANAVAGGDQQPAAELAYVSGTGWRERGDAATDQAGAALPPGEGFTVRRHSVAPVEVVVVGYVPQERLVVTLPAVGAGGVHDVLVGAGAPVARPLSDSGLAASDATHGAITARADVAAAGDEVLEYGADRRGLGVPPERRFALLASGWVEAEAAASEHPLLPGTGYLLRLRGARDRRFWVQPAVELP